MRGHKWTTLAVCCVLLGATGAAATAIALDAITARQQNFKAMGKANKAIMDELKNPAPAIGVLQANAKTLASLGPQIPNWFPAGTGQGGATPTKALPAIWQQNPQFRAAAATFATAARNLNAAAASGDVNRVRTSFGAVGAGCKGCHDTFRAR